MAGWLGRGTEWAKVGPNNAPLYTDCPALASAAFCLTLSLTSAPAASLTWCLSRSEANQTTRPQQEGALLAKGKHLAQRQQGCQPHVAQPGQLEALCPSAAPDAVTTLVAESLYGTKAVLRSSTCPENKALGCQHLEILEARRMLAE